MHLSGITLPGEPQGIPQAIPMQAGMDGSGVAGMMPSESIGETSESFGDMTSESLGDPHAGKIHQDMTSESLGEKRPPGAPPLEMAKTPRPSQAPAATPVPSTGASMAALTPAAILCKMMHRITEARSYRPQEYIRGKPRWQ